MSCTLRSAENVWAQHLKKLHFHCSKDNCPFPSDKETDRDLTKLIFGQRKKYEGGRGVQLQSVAVTLIQTRERQDETQV